MQFTRFWAPKQGYMPHEAKVFFTSVTGTYFGYYHTTFTTCFDHLQKILLLIWAITIRC